MKLNSNQNNSILNLRFFLIENISLTETAFYPIFAFFKTCKFPEDMNPIVLVETIPAIEIEDDKFWMFSSHSRSIIYNFQISKENTSIVQSIWPHNNKIGSYPHIKEIHKVFLNVDDPFIHIILNNWEMIKEQRKLYNLVEKYLNLLYILPFITNDTFSLPIILGCLDNYEKTICDLLNLNSMQNIVQRMGIFAKLHFSSNCLFDPVPIIKKKKESKE